MVEGKEFDSFISFKTFLDQYSKENNTVYCIDCRQQECPAN